MVQTPYSQFGEATRKRDCQTRECPNHRFVLDFTYTPRPYRRKSTVSGLTLYSSAVSLNNTTMRTWLWLRVGCYPFMAAYPTASAVWSPYYGKHQTLNSAVAPKLRRGQVLGRVVAEGSLKFPLNHCQLILTPKPLQESRSWKISFDAQSVATKASYGQFYQERLGRAHVAIRSRMADLAERA